MINLFVNMMLGHFVGDYLLQNQWMAVGKSHPGKRGHIACTVHVTLYTLAVSLFSGIWSLPFLAVVFVPHWIIDRWSLATYLLKWKNGYTMKQVWEKAPLCAAPAPDQLEQNVWKVAFAAPVYIANDNTLHFICLWLAARLFS
jgi:Protein of unknown function (DUF3307)